MEKGQMIKLIDFVSLKKEKSPHFKVRLLLVNWFKRKKKKRRLLILYTISPFPNKDLVSKSPLFRQSIYLSKSQNEGLVCYILDLILSSLSTLYLYAILASNFNLLFLKNQTRKNKQWVEISFRCKKYKTTRVDKSHSPNAEMDSSKKLMRYRFYATLILRSLCFPPPNVSIIFPAREGTYLIRLVLFFVLLCWETILVFGYCQGYCYAKFAYIVLM